MRGLIGLRQKSAAVSSNPVKRATAPDQEVGKIRMGGNGRDMRKSQPSGKTAVENLAAVVPGL